jgi:phenylpropionate dioxygenase-like ring-hydroxylating dioxygenase large terminal subunit
MKNYWYIAANSNDLKEKPLACKILNENLVLFRDGSGLAFALADRCPHRNVRLSAGRVINGSLRCPYHGWEFNGAGKCVYIPSLCEDETIPSQAFTGNFPLIEQDGFIWVWSGNRPPAAAELPFKIPHYDETGWARARLKATIKNSVDNVIENFIDCPHTGYIHGGLFRSPASHLAATSVKRVADGVIIDIEEENKSNSLLANFLLGKDQAQTHQDRFFLPALIQVAYSFGPKRQMIGYHFCTPAEDFVTVLNVCVTWNMGWLTSVIRPLVPYFGQKILDQDVKILDNQGAVIKKYGEHFTSTPADTANNWIKACRQQARFSQEPLSEKEKQVFFKL